MRKVPKKHGVTNKHAYPSNRRWGGISSIFNGHHIAAAKLAVDGGVEKKVQYLALHLQLGPDRPDMFWLQWQFRSRPMVSFQAFKAKVFRSAYGLPRRPRFRTYEDGTKHNLQPFQARRPGEIGKKHPEHSSAPPSIAKKFNGLEADRNKTAFHASYSLDGPHKAHGLRNVMRVDHLTRQHHLAGFYL